MSANTKTKRAPVIAILGHIDHGKSTLLDYLRKSNVVAGEAGGITQHLGAYEVSHTTPEGETASMTFLDTPGHEAFCTIRERGARSADIAILVVSAEDGVKPQTLDALRCIKQANIPFIVAINKIDKPNADENRTKQSLAEHEVYVEGWGGDIPVVPISALKGTNIPALLDMIILLADIQNLQGTREKAAEGTIIEAHVDKRKGIAATLLIVDGSLEIGSYVVSGSSIAPVRFIENHAGKQVPSASFSSPVRIIGWNKVPYVGEIFTVVKSKKEAEVLASKYVETGPKAKDTSENEEGVVKIPLILKADTVGSLDGLEYELRKVKKENVKIVFMSKSIGIINENDVKTAQSDKDSIIIGFHVGVDAASKGLAERSGVQIELSDIIYKLTEMIEKIAEERRPRQQVEVLGGEAKILATFVRNKDRDIVGGKVVKDSIHIGNEVRILRRGEEISRGKIRGLQKQKERAEEVKEGYEFGADIETKIPLAVGDTIQVFSFIEK